MGSTLIAPLHRTRADAYRKVMRVNLDSAVFMLQAWIASLNGERGAAVFASSVVARIGVANHEASPRPRAASKPSYAAPRPPTHRKACG